MMNAARPLDADCAEALPATAPALRLQRDDILRLMPQQGRMCLLDSAESLPQRIRCRAHVDAAHPLADGGHVSPVHALEFGAQAAALHRLATVAAQSHRPSAGWVLQGRDLRFGAEPLDTLPQPLQIIATCDSASTEAARYRYTVCAGGRAVASGEMTLLLTWP